MNSTTKSLIKLKKEKFGWARTWWHLLTITCQEIPSDVALEVDEIYRDNPVALYFDDTTVIQEQIMQFKIDLNKFLKKKYRNTCPDKTAQINSDDTLLFIQQFTQSNKTKAHTRIR